MKHPNAEDNVAFCSEQDHVCSTNLQEGQSTSLQYHLSTFCQYENDKDKQRERNNYSISGTDPRLEADGSLDDSSMAMASLESGF